MESGAKIESIRKGASAAPQQNFCVAYIEHLVGVFKRVNT